MTDTVCVERAIDDLEARLRVENDRIAAAISARQIGDGYWHEKRRLEERLRTARAIRRALQQEDGNGE